MSRASGPCGSQHPAYVTVNTTPLPRSPVPLAMPVGLLFEETRVSNPDAILNPLRVPRVESMTQRKSPKKRNRAFDNRTRHNAWHSSVATMAAHQATRVVPWKDWDEWEHVRGGLCGADPTARDVALARVDAWRTRGNVPHAVEVTAQLMECRKHDGGVPGSPGPHLSDNMLQLTYAMVRIARL